LESNSNEDQFYDISDIQKVCL